MPSGRTPCVSAQAMPRPRRLFLLRTPQWSVNAQYQISLGTWSRDEAPVPWIETATHPYQSGKRMAWPAAATSKADIGIPGPTWRVLHAASRKPLAAPHNCPRYWEHARSVSTYTTRGASTDCDAARGRGRTFCINSKGLPRVTLRRRLLFHFRLSTTRTKTVQMIAHSLSRVAILLGLTAIFLLCYSYAYMLWLRRRLPPGPFPLPLVGNMFSLPKTKPWIVFEQWSLDYDSPMITIWIGRTPQIIVNDSWTASELMEKRADIYSSRPRRVVMGDICGTTESNQVLLKYNDHWRTQRRIMVGLANPPSTS